MLSRSPTVSVVIPLHNRPELAERCLTSLESWSVPLEVLVVDDGSTDPGVSRLRRERDGRERWLSHPTPRGFSAAVNSGLAAATGDPLLLLNSDAEVLPGGDEALLAAFAPAPPGGAADSPVGAVGARLEFPDGRPQWSGGPFPSLAWLLALASGLGAGARWRWRRSPPSGFAGGRVDWAPGAALALARRAYAEVGAFDEGFRHYGQDLDYCERLRRAGWEVVVQPGFSVVHHLGATVASSSESRRAPHDARHDGQRLDLLWLDLLRWARRHRSPSWARRAELCLRLGGRFRQFRLASRSDSPEARAVAMAVAALENAGLRGDSPATR